MSACVIARTAARPTTDGAIDSSAGLRVAALLRYSPSVPELGEDCATSPMHGASHVSPDRKARAGKIRNAVILVGTGCGMAAPSVTTSAQPPAARRA